MPEIVSRIERSLGRVSCDVLFKRRCAQLVRFFRFCDFGHAHQYIPAVPHRLSAESGYLASQDHVVICGECESEATEGLITKSLINLGGPIFIAENECALVAACRLLVTPLVE